MLIKIFFAGAAIVPLTLAYPSSEGSSDSNLLFKRAGTTAQLGDYTGDTSSYPDGSGTYVDSKDQGTYASGVKCWTDIVSLLSARRRLEGSQRIAIAVLTVIVLREQ